MVKLSEKIKELRIEAELTQSKFGNLFGVVKSTVSLYENDKSTPSDDIKLRMCKYFNVSMDYLLGSTRIRNYEEHIDKQAFHDNASDYAELITKAESVLCDNKISDIEKEKLMLNLNEIFWRSKKKKQK